MIEWLRYRQLPAPVKITNVGKHLPGKLTALHLIRPKWSVEVARQHPFCTIAIDIREFSVLIHELAVDHDAPDMPGLGSVDQGIDDRNCTVQKRRRDTLVIQQHQVGTFTDFQRSDFRPKTDRRRAMLGSPPEDLRGNEWLFVESWLRMQVFHEPHLLQHISIVIQTGFVDAQGDRNNSCDELPHRRDSTSQSKLRTGVVTDTK